MNYAIIPARGGSRRIPGKNIKDFFGKPIIAYSIETAKESGLFDRIIVSTDSDRIADVADSYGVDVWMRRDGYGDDKVGTQAVVRECLLGLDIGSSDGLQANLACCIYATSPLMEARMLREGYYAIHGRQGVTFVFSVGYPELRDAAQFYWGAVYHFRVSTPLVNVNTRMIVIPDDHICDINTPRDWTRAEKMYRKLHP